MRKFIKNRAFVFRYLDTKGKFLVGISYLILIPSVLFVSMMAFLKFTNFTDLTDLPWISHMPRLSLGAVPILLIFTFLPTAYTLLDKAMKEAYKDMPDDLKYKSDIKNIKTMQNIENAEKQGGLRSLFHEDIKYIKKEGIANYLISNKNGVTTTIVLIGIILAIIWIYNNL